MRKMVIMAALLVSLGLSAQEKKPFVASMNIRPGSKRDVLKCATPGSVSRERSLTE